MESKDDILGLMIVKEGNFEALVEILDKVKKSSGIAIFPNWGLKEL